MGACPDCADTYELVQVIQEALKESSDEGRPFSLDGLPEVSKLWLTWMPSTEPLFSCTED